MGELREYGTLLLTNKMLRLNLIMFGCLSAYMVGSSVDMSFYISYHGISQTSAALYWFFKFPIGVLLFGVTGKICENFGMRKGFRGMMAASFALDVLLMPFFLA